MLREAEVVIKERGNRVRVVRESALDPQRNMQALTEMGLILLPPVVTFYAPPTCIQGMDPHPSGKVRAGLGIEKHRFPRRGTGAAFDGRHA